MINIKKLEKKILRIVIPTMILFTILIAIFIYFNHYNVSYKNRAVINISDNWSYYTGSDKSLKEMGDLRPVKGVPVNTPLYLTKYLNEYVENGELLLRSDHQEMTVYLNRDKIFTSPKESNTKNPGMGLYFVNLPNNYKGMKLTVEMTSPYSVYSGVPNLMYIGDDESLRSAGISKSLPYIIGMIICLASGLFIIVLATVESIMMKVANWGTIAFGVFSCMYAFYFQKNDWLLYQFFSPLELSNLNVGIYITHMIPLFIFFYFMCNKFKKWMIPSIVALILFDLVAFGMSIAGIVDLPQTINIFDVIFIIAIINLVVVWSLEWRYSKVIIWKIVPFFVLILFVTIFDIFMLVENRINEKPGIYTLIFMLYIITIWFINLKNFLNKIGDRNRELESVQKINYLQIESYNKMKSHIDEISYLRHEVKHYFAIIEILNKNENIDKIKEYIEKLSKENLKVEEVLFTKNIIVNSILSYYDSKFKEIGAIFNCNVFVPEEMKFSVKDLTSLIMNILENAFEALEKIDIKKTREVDINIKLVECYLKIKCINTLSDSKENDDLNLIKPEINTSGHGYGLKIIKRIVKKNYGIMKISTDEGKYSLDIAIRENEKFIS